MKEHAETEEFISESITPNATSFDTSRMAVGEPGLPSEFTWHGSIYKVKQVLKTWRKTSPCTHGSGEMYVRRHYYKVLTESGEKMTIYFDRQPQKGKTCAPRWWLLSKAK